MKICFTTTLDDKYLSGFLITFNSILMSSPNFNYDLIIFEWGELSDESKDIIKKLYSKVSFKMVDIDFYKTHQFDNTFREWTYNPNYRFDIFNLTEYDRIVFFDSDMIFEIDVEELLKYDVDFGACSVPAGRISQINNRMGFDAGLMTISKKYLNNDVKMDLIKIANSTPPYQENLKTRNWFGNEPILNTYFLDVITWLPNKFDLIVSEIKLDDLKIKNNYQFTGHNKPWYGNTFKDQFSKFAIDNITENNGKFLLNLILNRLIKIFKNQVDDLLSKNIDIYSLNQTISPIHEK
jgi:lipopolysaccharide biosynthesis glycosyltransferase